MEYRKFEQIFNKTIFENSKIVLLKKIAESPHRYIGLFRPTKPEAKILQNLLQSHQIRFGDAFEKLIEEYLQELGYELLDKQLTSGNDKLDLDQCFRDTNKTYFIEQKIRDDHDSTKIRGQSDNFDKKLVEMVNQYGKHNLIGIMYFIDPHLDKNKKYYQVELETMARKYGAELYLFYGKELFEFINHPAVWDEILNYLERWKKEIPGLPNTNFDCDAESSFAEIKDMPSNLYRKLFSNDEIFNEIIPVLFPEKRTLRLLLEYFNAKAIEKNSKPTEKRNYQIIIGLLKERL